MSTWQRFLAIFGSSTPGSEKVRAPPLVGRQDDEVFVRPRATVSSRGLPEQCELFGKSMTTFATCITRNATSRSVRGRVRVAEVAFKWHERGHSVLSAAQYA